MKDIKVNPRLKLFRENMKEDLGRSKDDKGFKFHPVKDEEAFKQVQNHHAELDYRTLLSTHDAAFFHALRKFESHLFVTLKFKKLGLKSMSDKAGSMRKQYIEELRRDLTHALNLSNQAIQYICVEEANHKREVHLHALFIIIRTDKVSVEATQEKLIDLIDPSEVIVPTVRTKDGPNPHVQKLQSPENALRYILKHDSNHDQQTPKTIILSPNFVKSCNRHMRWLQRQKAA